MKTPVAILLSLVISVAGANGGTIVGTVRAQGKAGADEGAGGGKYESRKFKFAERVDYSQLHDFIVYVDQKFAETPAPPAEPVHVVVQKDASFSPHVLPILVGT